MKKQKAIIYIGDFDFRNNNVQAHLVKNNGKIFEKLNYKVIYIGIDRKNLDISLLKNLQNEKKLFENYYELPNTLNVKGIFKYNIICHEIIKILDIIKNKYAIEFIITYQAPTYAKSLKVIAEWTKYNNIKYIVNCADLPIFDLQPIVKRIVMKINWYFLHKINKKYSDGVISVSKYIDIFYKKKGCESVIIPPLFDTSTVDLKLNSITNIPTFVYAGRPFAMYGKEVNSKGMKDRLDRIIDLFLEIYRQNIKFKFYIIGVDKNEYVECVPRQKEALEKIDTIYFLGRKTHKETINFVGEADFMINYRDDNLMTKAGFSTKVVESVSLGTPVIMNDISDTFEYLDENISGFKLSGKDTIDIEFLKTLCCFDVDFRKKIKRRCFESKIFDYNNYIDKFDYFFRKVQNEK